jgi:GNAT superfamily N-acetyltransferase
MDVRIRPAAAPDLPHLVRLLAELFSIEADFAPDAERQRFGLALMISDQRLRTVLVAERHGVILGMVTGQLVVSTAEGGLSAWVEDMIVERGARGGGVGRALLDALESWARSRGATRLQLLADRENTPALGFYERVGWSRTSLVALRRLPTPRRT